jgi:glycosidase
MRQELGLEEVIALDDDVRRDPSFLRQTLQQRQSREVHLGRDGCRVPLPWTPEGASMGFGPDGGSSAWLPQPPHWARLSVAAQEASDDSTLSRVRHAIAVRRACLPLLEGSFSWADEAQSHGAGACPAASEDSPFPVFSPLDDGLMIAASVSSALVGAAAAAWHGFKRLVHADDSDVIAFERRHAAAGCVLCVLNMGDGDAPLPQGLVQPPLHVRSSAHVCRSLLRGRSSLPAQL